MPYARRARTTIPQLAEEMDRALADKKDRALADRIVGP